nr:putative ribonuclease H-like domain-containing protein [Tanacetum cinerariifolium]
MTVGSEEFTNYSDSPVPTRVVDGVLQPVAPTTAEQRLARKNELKACGTLLMALPDKHQLKFNSHKDAKTLVEAIEKRFGGNTETKKVQKILLKQQYENFTSSSLESLDQIHDRLQKLISKLEILRTDLEEHSLDDLFNSLKIYEAEVKSSSSAGTTTQNIAFVSSFNTDSTTEPVSAAASVSAVSTKIPVSPLPNVDSLSNDVVYSSFASQSSSLQLDNDDLKQIDADDLEEIDLKWQMDMLTMRARRFLQRTGRNLGTNGPTSLGFDMSKVECYNCHRKGHFARECRSPKDTRRNGAAEPQRRNVPVETSTSNALFSQCDGVGIMTGVFKQKRKQQIMLLWPSHLQVLLLIMRYQSGNGYHAVPLPYTGTFMPPKPDLVFNNAATDIKTDHPIFTIKLSPTKPDQDLSLANRSSAPIIEDWVSNSKDESETKPPQTTAIPKPTRNGKRKNRKACFVCKSLDHLIKDYDFYEKKMAQPTARNHAHRENTKHYAKMTLPTPQRHVVPAAVVTRSKPVLITAVRPVSTAVLKKSVTRPKQVKPSVTKNKSPIRRHINRRSTPKASTSLPRVTAVKAPVVNAAKGLHRKWEWKPKCPILDHGNPQHALKDKGVMNSRCSRHMTGNMSYSSNFEELNGGYVAFGGNPKGGKIFGKGKIRTWKLDFDVVYFVKELEFNLFSVSQMCDKKNSVLFTDTECLVLSLDFKFPDESQVLLRVPRENNMYNVNLKNIVPSRDLTCLFAKATIDESNLWHRRLGHINFKTMNKLVKGNLVRGLPIKDFENDNTCVACKKGKQHRASYDYSRFTWVFVLATKDETSPILKTFITGLENSLSLKGKGIKKEFSVPRTPQQNDIVERKNRTLTEAARTMLADLLLPISFWTEAVNTACYVQNRVLVTKPHKKTPYELLHGRTPSIGFMRPFGCPVTILHTLDSLCKFDGKVDEGFLVGYSVSSKAFRVFNSRTHIVYETLHVNFLENKPNVAGSGPTWLFDIDSLTKTMNYQPVTVGNQSNLKAGFQDKFNGEKVGEESNQQYVIFLVWSFGSTNPQNTDGDDTFDEKEPEFDEKKPESEVNVSPSSSAQSKKQDDKTKRDAKGKSHVESFTGYRNLSAEFEDFSDNNFNKVNAAGTLVLTVEQISPNSTNTFSAAELEDITYSDDVGAETDFNNLETSITEELLQFKMQKVWVLVDLPHRKRAIGTKWVLRNKKDERGIVVRNNARLVAQGHTQEEVIDYEEVFAPVARIEAIRLFLAYDSFMGFMVYQTDVKSAFLYGTIEEEVYVCQPPGFEDPNHPDKEYKVVKTLYGLHQAPRAWYETLANYLLENGFQRGKIDQTLFIKRQKGDILLVQIYVDDIIFDSTNNDLCKSFEKLMKDKFQMSSIGELTFFLGLQVKQKKDGIFISQDKYIAEMLRKFRLTDGKLASTPIDTEKPLLKDPDGEDVDVHTYRSMIGSLIDGKVGVGVEVSAVDLQVFAVRLLLLLLVQKFLLFGLTNWCCSLSAVSSIKYALTVNPNIYVSCIKQFWTTVAVKKVNDVIRLQALVDKKKVMVTKATIREVLRLDDAEGVECLPNEEIFAELARMGYEKPSTKLTFYKAFFLSQWKKQVGDLLTHTLTHEVEEGDVDENVENVNSGDTAKEDVSAAKDEVPTDARIAMILLQEVMDTCTTLTRRVEHLELDKIAQALEITRLKRRVKKLERRNKVKVLKLRRKLKRLLMMLKNDQDAKVNESVDIQGRKAESQAEIYKIDLDHANKVVSMQEDESEPAKVQVVVDVVTTAKLIIEVVTATSMTITAAEVPVPAATTVAAPKLTVAPRRRTKGVVIRDPEESSTTTSTIIHTEAKSKDKGKGILVEEPKPLKKQAQIEQDEQYARELETKMNKTIDWDEFIDHVNKKAKEDKSNVAGFKMDYFKGMTYDDIRPVFEKHFDLNVAFLQKTNEQIDEDESRALKRINETLAEKAAKRQKLDEEVEELKRHLQIVPNEDDDVYTKATSLARKVPVVDYEIIEQNNKPYYKIIRADGTHQLYERFATAKPKNFSNDFLLITLGAMFEKPDIHAQIWKNQRSVHGPTKVKGWKLLELCDDAVKPSQVKTADVQCCCWYKIEEMAKYLMLLESLVSIVLNGFDMDLGVYYLVGGGGKVVRQCESVMCGNVLIQLELYIYVLSLDQYIIFEQGGPKEDLCMIAYQPQGVSVWEGAEAIHLQAEETKLEYSRKIITNSRETPSWREIVSLIVLVKLASFTTNLSNPMFFDQPRPPDKLRGLDEVLWLLLVGADSWNALEKRIMRCSLLQWDH